LSASALPPVAWKPSKPFSTRCRWTPGIAFVIIQHLSPKHKSIMASLLAKHTQMTVREIEDATPLEPNCVYLNPPNKNVAIFNQVLHLMEPVKTGAINMPIDYFFRSLSEDQKERAIAIVLSGTASDGTLGIKAVKGEGGMVMVQDPDTAKYEACPEAPLKPAWSISSSRWKKCRKADGLYQTSDCQKTR
jgi:two-component system CheB/CheR fusion protein